MVKKMNTAKKKTTDQLRKEAIKDIDVRLNGDATPSEKGSKSKGGKATKAATKKKAASKKIAKAAKTPNEKKARKPSGLDLAAQVLIESKEPLNAKTIAERAIAAGWKPNGKTPHATLYAAMIREISKKGKDARFRKADRGLFASSGKQAS